MAYQGTTYDPSRLLAFIEDARNRKANEDSERKLLELQAQQMEEDIKDRQLNRQLAKEQRKETKENEENKEKYLSQLRSEIDMMERQRATARGSISGEYLQFANALKEKYNAAAGQKIYEKFIPSWNFSGGGGGGGGKQDEGPVTVEGTSKDVKYGEQLWQQQLADTQANEEAKRQKDLEGEKYLNARELLRQKANAETEARNQAIESGKAKDEAEILGRKEIEKMKIDARSTQAEIQNKQPEIDAISNFLISKGKPVPPPEVLVAYMREPSFIKSLMAAGYGQ